MSSSTWDLVVGYAILTMGWLPGYTVCAKVGYPTMQLPDVDSAPVVLTYTTMQSAAVPSIYIGTTNTMDDPAGMGAQPAQPSTVYSVYT